MIILNKNKSTNCKQIISELNECGIAIKKTAPISYEVRNIPSNYTGELYGWVLERAGKYWIARTGVNPVPGALDIKLRSEHPNDIKNRSQPGLETFQYRFYNLEALKKFVSIVKILTRCNTKYRLAFLQLQTLDKIKNLLRHCKDSKSIYFYNENDKVLFSKNEIKIVHDKLLKLND